MQRSSGDVLSPVNEEIKDAFETHVPLSVGQQYALLP